MELVYNKSKPVAVTGMAFPTGKASIITVVGSEEVQSTRPVVMEGEFLFSYP